MALNIDSIIDFIPNIIIILITVILTISLTEYNKKSCATRGIKTELLRNASACKDLISEYENFITVNTKALLNPESCTDIRLVRIHGSHLTNSTFIYFCQNGYYLGLKGERQNLLHQLYDYVEIINSLVIDDTILVQSYMNDPPSLYRMRIQNAKEIINICNRYLDAYQDSDYNQSKN